MNDEYATVRLLDAEVGRSHGQLAGRIETSHAELSGKIDVLATAQHGLAESNRIASELSSAEHREVRTALATLTETVAGLVATGQADAAVVKWRRWAIGAFTAGGGLAVAIVGLVAGRM